MFDLSNPTVEGALLAAGISFFGVLIAVIAGYFGATRGARIGAEAAREAARISQQESQAARDEATAMEERRHARAVEQWHREKGVAAADAILDLMNELDLGLFSYWKEIDRTGDPDDPLGSPEPSPEQNELEPYYAKIRRHALAIKDEGVSQAMREMATALYGEDAIASWSGETTMETWHILLTETEQVLGAYIRGDPIPEAPGIHRLRAAVAEYFDEASRGGSEPARASTTEPEVPPTAER